MPFTFDLETCLRLLQTLYPKVMLIQSMIMIGLIGEFVHVCCEKRFSAWSDITLTLDNEMSFKLTVPLSSRTIMFLFGIFVFFP